MEYRIRVPDTFGSFFCLRHPRAHRFFQNNNNDNNNDNNEKVVFLIFIGFW